YLRGLCRRARPPAVGQQEVAEGCRGCGGAAQGGSRGRLCDPGRRQCEAPEEAAEGNTIRRQHQCVHRRAAPVGWPRPSGSGYAASRALPAEGRMNAARETQRLVRRDLLRSKRAAGNRAANHTVPIAEHTPQPTSNTRDRNMRSGVSTCGTSRRMVTVVPARRLAVATLKAQQTAMASTTAEE